MGFEIINDLFVFLRDIIGTICVVGIIIFIILWFFGRRRIKYYSFRTGSGQQSKENEKGRIVDIEAEEKSTFEKFDKET